MHVCLPDQQKGRSNKKNKKKKRPKSLSREITMAQAQQQMFGAYFKVSVCVWGGGGGYVVWVGAFVCVCAWVGLCVLFLFFWGVYVVWCVGL